jgi:hypothetical protein
VTTIAPIELTHAEKEAALLNACLAAKSRGDELEARRLWLALADLHSQRPAAVVEAMEKRMGLK